MDEKNVIPELTEKEKLELGKQIARLEPKVFKVREEYEKLLDQLAELHDRRHPERREKAIKETLYKTYLKSQKSLEQVINYMMRRSSDEDDELWDEW